MQMESTLVRTGAHACGTGPSMGPTVGIPMTDSLLDCITVAMLEQIDCGRNLGRRGYYRYLCRYFGGCGQPQQTPIKPILL